ncbi:MAG: phytanoyl-CoA dioxygenase family protein [Bacteroidota bacterium]
MKLNDLQIQEFNERGILRLENFIPAAIANQAAEIALEKLSKFHENEKWNYESVKDIPFPKANKVFNKRLGSLKPFKSLQTPELLEVISQLMGEEAIPWMKFQSLISVPDTSNWEVPTTTWHLDMPMIKNKGLPGIQMFTFLAEVRPGGGGTLVVAGSHRHLDALDNFKSKAVRGVLKREAFFRDLWSKEFPNRLSLMEVTPTDRGVSVQVVEMHGEPGDVYLMDLRILHTVAPNSLDSPRIMLTQRFAKKEMLEATEELRKAYLEKF